MNVLASAGPVPSDVAWEIISAVASNCAYFKMTQSVFDDSEDLGDTSCSEFLRNLNRFLIRVERTDNWPLGHNLMAKLDQYTFQLNSDSLDALKSFGHPFVFQLPFFLEDLLLYDSSMNWRLGVIAHEQMICIQGTESSHEQIFSRVPSARRFFAKGAPAR